MSALRVMSDMWAAYAAAWGGSSCEADLGAGPAPSVSRD